MPADRLGENSPFRDGGPVHRLHNADLKILDLRDPALGQPEQVGVDAVFSGRKHLDLRPLLPPVFYEYLAVLKRIVTLHNGGKDPSRRNRRTVHRLDQPDFIFADFGELAFRRLVDERDQEVQAGSERARLDADLVAESHHPSLRHLVAEPPAFEQGDLLAANGNHRRIDQHRRRNQHGQIPPILHNKIENHTIAFRTGNRCRNTAGVCPTISFRSIFSCGDDC